MSNKWTQAAQIVKERTDATRADLDAILERVTALKTIYNLMPDELKTIIAKYTEKTP